MKRASPPSNFLVPNPKPRLRYLRQPRAYISAHTADVEGLPPPLRRSRDLSSPFRRLHRGSDGQARPLLRSSAVLVAQRCHSPRVAHVHSVGPQSRLAEGEQAAVRQGNAACPAGDTAGPLRGVSYCYSQNSMTALDRGRPRGSGRNVEQAAVTQGKRAVPRGRHRRVAPVEEPRTRAPGRARSHYRLIRVMSAMSPLSGLSSA
jgi:hypothetical protein